MDALRQVEDLLPSLTRAEKAQLLRAVVLDLDDAFGISALHIVIERDDPALDRRMEARLVHLLVGHATSFKLHCVDRLPRTQMGKVQRNLLKQSLDHRTVA